MKEAKIKDYMTVNPLTINVAASMSEAHKVMREYNIRRLPVVDNKRHLVGIVSLSDVHEAEPSDATTLSIHELTYLLAKLTVKEIMTKDPFTVTPEQSIAEAARLMMEQKIGGLPVVDGPELVGIITESDIFRMVVDLYA